MPRPLAMPCRQRAVRPRREPSPPLGKAEAADSSSGGSPLARRSARRSADRPPRVAASARAPVSRAAVSTAVADRRDGGGPSRLHISPRSTTPSAPDHQRGNHLWRRSTAPRLDGVTREVAPRARSHQATCPSHDRGPHCAPNRGHPQARAHTAECRAFSLHCR